MTTAPSRGTSPAITVPPCDPVAVVATWPLRLRLGQLLMVGVPGRDGSAAQARIEADLGIGGVFVYRPGDDVLASKALVGLAGPTGIPVGVAIDDEGGRVQTLARLAGELPSARELAALSPGRITALAEDRGRVMRNAGVTIDLAPVVDVSNQGDDEVIGDRSWGPEAMKATAGAGAFAAGLRTAGITPVLKHFPGHGRALGDSHEVLATTPPLTDLQHQDLIPFRELAGSGAWVMVGHLVVPDLTEGEVASLSPAAINGLLRAKLGFDGVVISDELGGMQAVSSRYKLAEAIRRFLAAGGDVALWKQPGRSAEVLSALEQDVTAGRLLEDPVNRSVVRVLTSKGVDPCTSAGMGG